MALIPESSIERLELDSRAQATLAASSLRLSTQNIIVATVATEAIKKYPLRLLFEDSDNPVKFGDPVFAKCDRVNSQLLRNSAGGVLVCHRAIMLSPIKMPIPSHSPLR